MEATPYAGRFPHKKAPRRNEADNCLAAKESKRAVISQSTINHYLSLSTICFDFEATWFDEVGTVRIVYVGQYLPFVSSLLNSSLILLTY